jgi:hypothetical protein
MSELYTMNEHHRELSGVAMKSDNKASPGMRLVALLIVVAFA